MEQYISTIIYICIFCIILELILPENKLKKYVNVLAGLIIIITLISPIIDVLKNETVVSTISNKLKEIQNNIEVEEYNFSNLQNRLIFSSVKEDLEDDIYKKSKEEFKLICTINKVKINLNMEYKTETVDVYVEGNIEVNDATKIIDWIAKEYQIDEKIVNVIKE